MIDFQAIEYFFSKEKSYHIPFSLQKQKKVEKNLVKREIIPTKAAPVKKKDEGQKPLPLPKKKTPQKKDSFYAEWEKKYKELRAENLLAKEPLKRHALFVVDRNSPEEFAQKIASAINTRIMKTTFLVHDGELETLLEEYNPTHLIYTKNFKNSSKIPAIKLEDLKVVAKDTSKKRSLWETIKSQLKS